VKVFGKLTIIMLLALLLVGCGGMGKTKFVHPEFNFGYTERVAVIPFENLTTDQGAGARCSRMFVSELLAAEAFDVVEPGEVLLALGKMNLVRTADLTIEQAKALGRELRVQALLLGTVGESTSIRGGSGQTNVVTLTTRMVETDSGITVWSATNTANSKGFFAGLFGMSGSSPGEVMRACVKENVESLFD
jgi:TolB-like protein